MSWLQLSRLWHALKRVRVLVLLFTFGMKWLCTAGVRRLKFLLTFRIKWLCMAAGSNTFGIKWLCIAVGSDTCNVAQIWFEVAMHRGGSNTCTVVYLWFQVATYALRRVLPSAPLGFLPVFDERLLSWLQAALGVSPLRPGDGNPTMVPLRGEGVAGLSSVIVASLSSIIMQWLIVLVNGLVHTVQVIFSLRSKHIQVIFSLYMLNENIFL